MSRSTAVPFDWSHEAPWPAVLEGANAIYVIVDESPHGVDRLGRFLDLSNARGVQRIVLLSARDWIDADRVDGLALEDLVRRSGMEWTILRPAWFAQNFDAPGYFADGIRRGRILHASGDGRCSFVDARDIAGVANAVLTEPGHHRREYALSGPDAITMSDVAKRSGAPWGGRSKQSRWKCLSTKGISRVLATIWRPSTPSPTSTVQ